MTAAQIQATMYLYHPRSSYVSIQAPPASVPLLSLWKQVTVKACKVLLGENNTVIFATSNDHNTNHKCSERQLCRALSLTSDFSMFIQLDNL